MAGAIWPTPKSNHMLSGLTLPSQNNQTSAPIYQISIHKIIHSQKLSHETIWTSLLSPSSKIFEKQACRAEWWESLLEKLVSMKLGHGPVLPGACSTFLFKNGDWTLIEQFEMLFTASGKKSHWKWIFLQSGEIKAIVGLEARKLMRKCTFWDLASNTYNKTNQTNII